MSLKDQIDKCVLLLSSIWSRMIYSSSLKIWFFAQIYILQENKQGRARTLLSIVFYLLLNSGITEALLPRGASWYWVISIEPCGLYRISENINSVMEWHIRFLAILSFSLSYLWWTSSILSLFVLVDIIIRFKGGHMLNTCQTHVCHMYTSCPYLLSLIFLSLTQSTVHCCAMPHGKHM